MELCRWWSGAFFASGAVFLTLRLCKVTGDRSFIIGAAICFAAAVLFSFLRARHTLPDEKTLTVFMSSLVPGGGVVLSSAECGTSLGESPPLPDLPKIRFEKKFIKI